MRDTLKRMLSHFGSEPAVQTAHNEEDVTMDGKDTGGAAANVVDVAALSASFATVTEQLTASQAKVIELTALLESAAEFKAKAEKQVHDAKMAGRKVKVVAAVGTEKADALMAATSTLEDAQFDAVVAAMATSVATEAASEPFKEVGVDAKADASKLASNPTMDYLRAKYPQA